MTRWILSAILLLGVTPAQERYRLTLRDQSQEVTLYRAPAKAATAIIFLPGDGGWRGFAVEMGASLARAGFDVYGWDVKRYLSGFTTSRGALTENDVQRDIGTFGHSLAKAGYQRLVLVGWSQGAAMATLAAAAPDAKAWLRGIVLLGLPERGVLGWRFADNITYLTKAEPDEPKFATAPALPNVAPVRLSMIQSTADEYLPLDKARQLFALAREPKRFTSVTARNHRYEGNQEEFLRLLAAQTRWAGGEE